jgi:hypothetical protein
MCRVAPAIPPAKKPFCSFARLDLVLGVKLAAQTHCQIHQYLAIIIQISTVSLAYHKRGLQVRFYRDHPLASTRDLEYIYTTIQKTLYYNRPSIEILLCTDVSLSNEYMTGIWEWHVDLA